MTAAPPSFPVHPAARAQRRSVGALAAVAGVAGLGAAGLGYPSLAIVSLAFGAWLGRTFVVLPQQVRVAQIHNKALEHTLAGRDDEALQLLAWLTPRDRAKGPIARGACILEATIALNRGDVARSVQLATSAVTLPFPRLRLHQLVEETQRAKGLALRALAQASDGHEAEALADAAAAECAPGATPDVLARANLARSVVLARKNDRPAVAAHLAQTIGPMLIWLTPRERALVRALRRMARAPAKSVYREAAKPAEEAEEARLASWIGRVAPGAEAFAQDARSNAGSAAAWSAPADASSPRAPVVEPRRKPLLEAPAAQTRRVRFVVIWTLLMFAFFVAYEALSRPSGGGTSAGLPSPSIFEGLDFTLVFGVVFGILFAGPVVYQSARNRRDARAIIAARLDVARGEHARAAEVYGRLTAPTHAIDVAAAAHYGLAQLAWMKADWRAAHDQSEAGLRRFVKHDTQRAIHSDLLYPELLAMRALALAAMDRRTEAENEEYLLAKECPGYVLMDRARYSIRLISAVRAWARAGGASKMDLETAAEVAAQRSPDLALPIQIDMLADVASGAARRVPAEERERIDGELRDDTALCAWIDAVAPGLRDETRARVALQPEARAAAEAVLVEAQDAAEPASARRLASS